jgi:hypothetical protein
VNIYKIAILKTTIRPHLHGCSNEGVDDLGGAWSSIFDSFVLKMKSKLWMRVFKGIVEEFNVQKVISFCC